MKLRYTDQSVGCWPAHGERIIGSVQYFAPERESKVTYLMQASRGRFAQSVNGREYSERVKTSIQRYLKSCRKAATVREQNGGRGGRLGWPYWVGIASHKQQEHD